MTSNLGFNSLTGQDLLGTLIIFLLNGTTLVMNMYLWNEQQSQVFGFDKV